MRAEGSFEPLSEEERAATLRRILAAVKPGADAWLFGYGSLMWNPMVHFREQRPALLHGFHRRYCYWARTGRASPETPGLGLGLDRGGACRGIAYRIPGDEVADELELLWRREMVSGIYLPRWVAVRTARGKVRALTFVVDRGHERYVGVLPAEKVAGHIATAVGWRGSARSYLENTVARLAELGFTDRYLARLHELVLCESAE